MGRNYSSIPKLQRVHRWSFDMETQPPSPIPNSDQVTWILYLINFVPPWLHIATECYTNICYYSLLFHSFAFKTHITVFMPPPLGAGGIMFSGCPSVRPSVRPKPEIPSFDLYMGPLVHPTNRNRFMACPSVRPSVCPSVRLSVRPSGEVSGHLPDNA